MVIICTKRFHAEFARLSKSNSYSDLTGVIKDSILSITDEFLRLQTNLNGRLDKQHLKIKLKGQGLYRIVALYIPEKKLLCLEFIYPHKGAHGATNIADDMVNTLLGEAIDALENKQYQTIKATKKGIAIEDV